MKEKDLEEALDYGWEGAFGNLPPDMKLELQKRRRSFQNRVHGKISEIETRKHPTSKYI